MRLNGVGMNWKKRTMRVAVLAAAKEDGLALQHQAAHSLALRQPCQVDGVDAARGAIRRAMDVDINHARKRILLRSRAQSRGKTQQQAEQDFHKHLPQA